MPVLVHGRGVRKFWAGKKPVRGESRSQPPVEEGITIALINNMPDAALEDTEFQFLELMNRASAGNQIHVKLFSLPHIARGERVRSHLHGFYTDCRDLLNNRFDGVIVTGAEPLHPDLRDEPYWNDLTQVLDWAEQNTFSTILSCLAAHAGVLHSDGITRRRLENKQFGVFGFRNRDHFLTEHIATVVPTPHSRWNEVQEAALVAAGYDIIASSAHAGVNTFVKKKKNSLLVHFQGHPEYSIETLLKEYRRDIRRFLRDERESYPAMPCGYFNGSAARMLADFQAGISSSSGEEQMDSFPEISVSKTLVNTWELYSVELYRNWLYYLAAQKSGAPAVSAVSQMTS